MRAKKLLTSRQIFRYAVLAHTVTKNGQPSQYYMGLTSGSIVDTTNLPNHLFLVTFAQFMYELVVTLHFALCGLGSVVE